MCCVRADGGHPPRGVSVGKDGPALRSTDLLEHWRRQRDEVDMLRTEVLGPAAESWLPVQDCEAGGPAATSRSVLVSCRALSMRKSADG